MYNPVVSRNNILRWTFDNIQNWDGQMRVSDEFEVENVKWKIGIDSDHNHAYLCAYLKCYVDEEEEGKSWIVAYNANFKLYEQCGTTNHFVVRQPTHYSTFESEFMIGEIMMRWDESERQIFKERFIRNDCLIIGVEVDFTYYNVSKKIPNFTDVILRSGSFELNMNKGFLSTVSKFFREFFTENEQESHVVVIPDVRLDLFMKFFMFLHPVHVELSEFHDEDILGLADAFGVQIIHLKNEEYMINHSELSTIENLEYAEKYGYERLARHVIDSLDSLEKVTKVVKTSKFEELSKELKYRVLYKMVEFL